ncbi:glycan-binding surface protein [Marinilabilia salmonicolor]|uniref:glycan-binding surface protein n=1 Tax=Marinilabilia salmonicolor TaxID=989 RepID=UPI001F204072|nr:glycan-binding surface protein [Marinilabilia salmonicolor]
MKKYIKRSRSFSLMLLLLIGFLAGSVMSSCEDDSDSSGDSPKIEYVRVTDPQASDSLVVRAFLGNTIAMVGEGLGDVVEVWFNDQSAKLNKNYITDETIIVTIPNVIPEEVTNQIKLVTAGGTEYTYGFEVQVPQPLLRSMKCEYVPAGGVAIIEGNYFLGDENKPLEVIFPGNVAAEVESYDVDEIRVIVPEGVGVGPITVKSMYGSTRSSFYFRDDRNVFLDFDQTTGAGWRAGNTQGTSPDGVSGDYLALTGTLGDWGWVEDNLAMNLWGSQITNPLQKDPLFELGENNLEDMTLKFEVNVVNPWAVGYLQCIFTPKDIPDPTDLNNGYYNDMELGRALWRPWHESGEEFQTDGWITVSIPMKEFRFSHDASINSLSLEYPGDFGGFTFFVFGPAMDPDLEQDLFIAIDNVRVVPR